jgi:transcriptional antiterminator NusG
LCEFWVEETELKMAMQQKSGERRFICQDNDWVALLVRVNHERSVGAHLVRFGYERFIPTRTATATSGAKQEMPLFPGYVFARFQLHNPHRMVHAPGVIRLLGDDHGPAVVPEQEIESIRRITAQGVYAEPWKFMIVGDRVRVVSGPLSGVEGLLVEKRNGLRLVISVTLLRRAVAVVVKASEVEPLRPCPLPGGSRGAMVAPA